MRHRTILLVFILGLFFFTGCQTLGEVGVKVKFPADESTTGNRQGKGPPPHAPAHGYRHKNKDGVELQYDSGLGVYVSVKIPGVYYYNGWYIRVSGSTWEVSYTYNGPWQAEKQGQVPRKLKKAKGPKGKAKGHSKKKKK